MTKRFIIATSLEKISTLRDSVGAPGRYQNSPGILIGEINPTLSRPVLTSSKMGAARAFSATFSNVWQRTDQKH